MPWFEISLACAADPRGARRAVANRLITALGGYIDEQEPAALQPLSVLRPNVPMTARSVLALFGADVWGARGGLNQAFAVIHLAGAALVVAAIALAGLAPGTHAGLAWPRRPRRPGRGPPRGRDRGQRRRVLPLFRIRHVYAAHEIGPVLSLGAALAGRLLGGPLLGARLLGARLVPALAAVLACYAIMLGVGAARPQVPPANAAVAGWLTSHGLRSGIAPYWEATSVTLDSGGTIAMGSVVPARGGLAPWHWEEDMRLFRHGHRADFLLTIAGMVGHPGAGGEGVRPPGRDLPFPGLHDHGLAQEPAAAPGPPGPLTQYVSRD